MVHMYSGILLSHKKKWNYAIFWDVGGPRDCHIEWNKSEREKQILYINTCIWNPESGTDEHICRAGIETQM